MSVYLFRRIIYDHDYLCEYGLTLGRTTSKMEAFPQHSAAEVASNAAAAAAAAGAASAAPEFYRRYT